MKNLTRLAAGARLGNTPEGTIVMTLVDYDGGPFELTPKIDADGLWLVDPARPSGYGLRITGDPVALGRLGKALLTVERNADGSGDADSNSE